MTSWIRSNAFLLALLAALAMAWVIPEAGASGGWLRPELVMRAGIALIFFNLGLMLPTEKLARDLRDWRLHLLVQTATFVAFPALALILLPAFGGALDPSLMLGFYYLAILPSTLTTAAVFTMNAGGNTAGAVFNTSASNLLGVFLVPAWMFWILAGTSPEPISPWPMLTRAFLFQLVPLAAGQLVRPHALAWVAGHQALLRRSNNSVIFFVVFASACDAVVGGVWRDHGWSVVGLVSGVTVALVIGSMATLWYVARWLGMEEGSRWCAMYCGSQKSLGIGAALLPVVLAPAPEFQPGLVLLPIFVFHFFQLLIGSVLPRFRTPPTACASS